MRCPSGAPALQGAREFAGCDTLFCRAAPQGSRVAWHVKIVAGVSRARFSRRRVKLPRCRRFLRQLCRPLNCRNGRHALFAVCCALHRLQTTKFRGVRAGKAGMQGPDRCSGRFTANLFAIVQHETTSREQPWPWPDRGALRHSLIVCDGARRSASRAVAVATGSTGLTSRTASVSVEALHGPTECCACSRAPAGV